MLKKINKELVQYTLMVLITGMLCGMCIIKGVELRQTLGDYYRSEEMSINHVNKTGMLGFVEKNEEKAPWMTRNERLVVLALQAEHDANETRKSVRIDVDKDGHRWIHEYDSSYDIYDVIF